ncbi:hypothetical protein N0V95_008062 [Ascochyta clinopodiicola]|nr:hypothetical protein N0V95_008062 [Ascochyta clinopodiicola]
MARLNTHLSATPQQTRSSTVDSLYRDPSVAPRHASNARGSTYSVMSPSQSSDKENMASSSREITPQPAKRRGLSSASGRIPTPDTGSTIGSANNKRRRTGDYSMNDASEVYEDGEGDAEEDADQEARAVQEATHPEEEDVQSQLYNPNQDPEKRRQVRYQLRDNHRQLEENRDELIKSNNSGLYDLIVRNNTTFGKVRQTADATVDSRFLVSATDLASKKLQNSLHGSGGAGIDLDQFVSKCIYFMKSGGYRHGEEDAPAIAVADDEEEDTGDGLDWALFGRQACFPSNKRPPVSSFLLGPLSVQKRVRTTQRRATQKRAPVGPATRPQEVREGDITQSENSNLTHLVKGIKSKLEEHMNAGMAGVESEMDQLSEQEEWTGEDQNAACKRFRLAMTADGEAAVRLFDFAINPHDFGQTIENLFYVSFLVREGNAQIVKDQDGLPLLLPAAPRGISEQRDQGAQKHQAVFSIDYSTWQMFIEAYNIKEPLIPHRVQEEENGGARWY